MVVRLIRKVDSKGRIVIPKEVLDSAGIKPGDGLSFTLTKSGGVVMRKEK